MTLSLIVFDLDGVLIDSAPGIRHSLDHALACAGLAPSSDDEALALMGPPLHSGIGQLVAARGGDGGSVEQLVADFRRIYAVVSMRLTTVHVEAVDLVVALRARGHRTALATSKPRPATEPLLAQFGLDMLLDPIECPVDVAADSKTDVLRRVIQTVGAEAREVAMVGDRSHDMIAALHLGAWAVGAGWGYGSHDELIAAGAHVVARRPDDVLRAIEERDAR
jgi:phosphoglycolate phosphatase